MIPARIGNQKDMGARRSVYFRYFRIEQRARRWGMFCTTCGESRIAPHQPYPPVEHPQTHHFDWEHGRRLREYQIVYLSEGSGWLETDKVTGRVPSRGPSPPLKEADRLKVAELSVRVGAGDAFLLSPGLWHRYKPDPAVGWHEHWVGFAGDTVERIFQEGFFDRGSNRANPVVRIRNEKTMLECFRQLFQSVRENTPALQQVLAAQTGMLLSLMLSSTQPASPQGQGRGMHGPSQVVERARALMVAEETREMPLQKLAKELNVSYSAFRRTFREHMGVSPHQYRLHLKVSGAREMLRSTALSVKEIAYKSGFEDEQYFCRIFKQQTGSTPSNFRKS